MVVYVGGLACTGFLKTVCLAITKMIERINVKQRANNLEAKKNLSTEKKLRVTRADVARHAGVSETIVSYVVNNNRYVAADKRKRVEQAIADLNYRPNAIARALRKKSSHQILLIADVVLDEYYSEILLKLDQFAYDKGYLVSLCKYHNVDSYLDRVLSSQFDGIIINSAGFKEEYIQQIARAGIPVVLFLTKKYEQIPAGVATIDSGLYQGAIAGLEKLWQKGARNIVYLAEPLKKRNLKKDIRFLAFQAVCKRHGLAEVQISAQTFAGYEEQQWPAYFLEYLKANPQVDAIFARNDRSAAIAAKIVQSLGKKIPQQMMILGVDNSSISHLMTPGITTIEQQKEAMSKAAIELIEKMNHGTDIQQRIHRVFETKLIERESTGVADS